MFEYMIFFINDIPQYRVYDKLSKKISYKSCMRPNT